MDATRQSILFIGEDPIEGDSLQEILRQNYRVVTAQKGVDPVDIARSQLPDVILLNKRIFDQDRNAICRRLQTDPQTSHIPILMICEPRKFKDIQTFGLNVLDIIAEPVQLEVVKARIRNYMELKRFREQPGNSSCIDPLTGIANRQTLEAKLTLEWRRAMRYQAPQSLILADIDFFDALRSHYGQAAGDDCLCRVAESMAKCVQREIDCVARFDEDEFACLLPETDQNGATQVARRIQDTVDELNITHAGSPAADHVTLSFGVATVKPIPRLTPTILLEQAHALLSEARQKGHNQIKSAQV